MIKIIFIKEGAKKVQSYTAMMLKNLSVVILKKYTLLYKGVAVTSGGSMKNPFIRISEVHFRFYEPYFSSLPIVHTYKALYFCGVKCLIRSSAKN